MHQVFFNYCHFTRVLKCVLNFSDNRTNVFFSRLGSNSVLSARGNILNRFKSQFPIFSYKTKFLLGHLRCLEISHFPKNNKILELNTSFELNMQNLAFYTAFLRPSIIILNKSNHLERNKFMNKYKRQDIFKDFLINNSI